MPRLTQHLTHWPEGRPHELLLPDRNLYCNLQDSAQARPDQCAIYFYGREISYDELNRSVLACAGYLQQRLDVQRGERVMLLMQNCPQFVMAQYAVLRAGAVVVALNPMSTASEIAWYAQDAGARTIITTQEFLPQVQEVMAQGELQQGLVSAASDFAGQAADVPWLNLPDIVREPRQSNWPPQLHDFCGALQAGIAPGPITTQGDDLAVLGYTSGTTGKPKGAMLSHKNFVHVVAMRACWLNEQADESELLVLPVNHLAGMNSINQTLYVGRCMNLMARWDAATAVALIEQRRVAAWGAVAPMLMSVFSMPDIEQRDLSSLKRIYGGATAMPEALIARVEKRLGISFVESYGMTESCGGTHINPPQAARRQCAGIPVINCDARVIDHASGVELGADQQGEIVVNSPTVMQAYWNRPEATAETFITLDGKRFLRTGDIGFHDADGYFYITDRLKRMINASGFKIWPAEIESALFAHPDVQEACVISARDAQRGETVKALLVLQPEARGRLTPEEITEWTRSQMATYKVPKLVEFVDSLPKTISGKLLWREVQDQQNAADQRALS